MTDGSPPRILFIARSFPPDRGGLENFGYWLAGSMSRQAEVFVIVNRGGRRFLPTFLPYALSRSLFLIRSKRIQAVHLADGLLAPLGYLLAKGSGVPVTCSVHGLDLTYENRLYQALVIRALSRLNALVANSAATKEVVARRIEGPMPTHVVSPGVNRSLKPCRELLGKFAHAAGLYGKKRVILSVGRLVERKGVAWFVEHVLPRLPEDVLYVVIGEGRQRSTINVAASFSCVASQVRMIGEVSDDMLAAAYHSADVMVMPNLPVRGDMEGFGLVALEAAVAGLPVVASRIEGITDAIQHGRNGILVEAGDVEAYSRALMRLLAMPGRDLVSLGEMYARYTLENYSWTSAAERYVGIISRMIAGRDSSGIEKIGATNDR